MFDGNGVPPGGVALRVATVDDALAVADLHVLAISEGFLASLGSGFLRRLYARISVSSHGFLIVATGDGGGVIGFVAGASSVGGLYREFLLRDGALAVATSLPHLIRSIPRVIETLRYGTKDDSVRASGGGEAELLSLAVAGSARKRGAGAALVKAFFTAAAGGGSTTARVVVGATNETAIRLYEGAGFAEAERFEVHEGTTSLLLRADLADVSPR